MRKYLLIILLFASLTLIAQEFKSGAAIKARERYRLELKKVEEIKLAAEKQYKKDLETALAAAMKAGNLDEANEIKAAIDKKVSVKEDTDIPNNEIEKVSSKLALKLSDKHDGIVSSAKSYKEIYTLNLRMIKQKKIILTVVGECYQATLNVFSIKINNESAGNIEIKNKPDSNITSKSYEFDITSLVRDSEIKEYEVVFKSVTLGAEFSISEVKATYK